eukprot:TRINITY_DN3149_c0_g1_i1.p1 TRINITY_DN3149_c0_g1~~TRINITY_DN3149_c0_g1_i1.p1  ORF type:complete len:53 (-),score=11.68 TRINITY_DN3149_c0_g1_i1:56-214(-)
MGSIKRFLRSIYLEDFIFLDPFLKDLEILDATESFFGAVSFSYLSTHCFFFV